MPLLVTEKSHTPPPAHCCHCRFCRTLPLPAAAHHCHTPYPPIAAGTVLEVGYHYLRGGWVNPHKLFLEDGAEGKAETLALLTTFYRACKQFAPVKLRGALLIITPNVKRFVGRLCLAVVALGEAATAAVRSVLGGDVYQTLAQRRLRRGCLITSSTLLPTWLRPESYCSEMRTNLVL